MVEEETEIHEHRSWCIIIALAALEQSQGKVLGQGVESQRVQALGLVALLAEKPCEPETTHLQAQQHTELGLELQIDACRVAEEQLREMLHELLDGLLAGTAIQADRGGPRGHRVLRLGAYKVAPIAGLHAGTGLQLVGLIPQAGQGAAVRGATAWWHPNRVHCAPQLPAQGNSSSSPDASLCRRLYVDLWRRGSGLKYLTDPLHILLHVQLAASGSSDLSGSLVASRVTRFDLQ